MYVNGILDRHSNFAGAPGGGNYPTYVGRDTNGHYFDGYIDNLVIFGSVETLQDDWDCDGMSGIYEIMRSKDGLSNQYNPIEYNGRYALLCAPVREDSEIQYKYDVARMREYMMANGMSDCDMIILTCIDNTGRSPDLSLGGSYNGGVDGEAYRDNLITALDVLNSGGSFQLEKADGTFITYSFALPSNKDIVYIELIGPGDDGTFYTYEYGDYSDNADPTSRDPDICDGLDAITAKYMIIVLDFTESGSWIQYINDGVHNNRAVVTSQDNVQDSDPYALLFYGRMDGQIEAEYSDSGTITYESHSETQNADGVYDLDVNRDPVRESAPNGIICIQEARYFANAVDHDRFDDSQYPDYGAGGDIPTKLYL